MKAVSYLRVSTDEQADSGLSLQHQRQKCSALADLEDWVLVAILEDAGLSAKSLHRPGLQEVLGMVRARKVQAVIVYKLDRLTRNQKDLIDLLETFHRYRVKLVSVSEHLDTESATGRMLVSILGVIAEWERGIISERTSAALGQLKRNGRRFSRIPPFGWEYDAEGNMVEVAEEQQTLGVIHRLSNEGRSLRQVIAELHRQGRRPRNGKRWHPKVIASLKEVRTA